MEIVDIDHWASNDIRTITVSQVFLHAPYNVEVREFQPDERDTLVSNTDGRNHRLSPFAIADMQRTASTLEALVDTHTPAYIQGALKESDIMVWRTFMFAFQSTINAKVCSPSMEECCH